jgi:hypothetical protein
MMDRIGEGDGNESGWFLGVLDLALRDEASIELQKLAWIFAPRFFWLAQSGV